MLFTTNNNGVTRVTINQASLHVKHTKIISNNKLD